MLKLEIPSKDEKLKSYQQQAEYYREFSEGEGKIEAQYIGYG